MIKNIRIRNFKSLRDVTVDLDPITVFVGRGGTGKSNFVNAIAFIRDCLLTNNNAIQDWGGANEILFRAGKGDNDEPSDMCFDIAFAIPGQDGEFRYQLTLSVDRHNRQLHINREIFAKDGETIFDRQSSKWLKEPAITPLPNAVPMTLELAGGIPEIGHAFVILTSGIGCYDFDSDVLQGKPNRRQQKQHEVGFDDDGGNFLQCLEAINRNFRNVTAQKEILASLRRLKPALRNLGLAMPGRDRVNVTLHAKDVDVVFSLAQESEGFRRFLAHLIAIYQVPPKSLVVFEEPEKGMYPGALSALAEQITAFPSASQGQILLTTHNPLLLNYFEPHQIRVVDMIDLETRIGRVSKPQMEALHEQLGTTGDLLTVDPAQLASDATS